MQKQQNNYAFIDSQNLYLGVLGSGWKIDYKKFRVYLKEKYNASKAFLFIGYLEGNNDLRNKLEHKRKNPARTKP